MESPQFIRNSAHYSFLCPSQIPLAQSVLGPPGLCPCWLRAPFVWRVLEYPFISTSAIIPGDLLSVEHWVPPGSTHFRFSYTAREPSAQRAQGPPSPLTASASSTLPRHLLHRAAWDSPTCAYISFTCSAKVPSAPRTLGHPSLH